jgi:hypothetical protein
MTVPADHARTVDPVAEPDDYRREILSWLGDDEPAAVLAATTAALRAIVRDADDRLRVRPEPLEWSVIECVGHLVDAELVVATRVRWILAEDEPDIVGYDQDRWVDTLRHRDADPEDLIALFDAVRSSNLRLWAATPLAAREQFGRHRESGPESYEMTVRLAAGHDRFHLAQAERALAAVRGG